MIDKCYIIPVEKRCNANCEFCISKSRNYNKGVDFLDINSKFIENLEVLKKKGIKKFEISGGGEPTLHSKIDVIVSLIKTIIPDSYVKLYTNGNILKNVGPVDEINISVVHYFWKTNDKIMGLNKSVSLEEKLEYFNRNNCGAKIRLSVPLINGAIDSPIELDKLIEKTKWGVDEYVVRTLYPGCPGYENMYVDFMYNNDKVIFERDNNVDDFSSIIMWSDGKLYTNWELDNLRYLNSYLLLKPDARVYINELDNLIKDNNFNVRKRILVNDFVYNAISFYQDKSKEYLNLVKRHLSNSARLFGNEGLIYILDKDVSLSDLVKYTYELKLSIREKFSFTGNYGGYVNYDGENYHLNLVHAPDPVVDFYNRDINIINNFNNVRDISDDEFSLVKKYRSFNL